VVFINHMPHQGSKERDDMERSNVVCHYQVTPMHDAISYCMFLGPGVMWGRFRFQKDSKQADILK